jgi:transposase
MSEYYLGIDVSKGYGDFALLNKKKEVVEKPFQLDDTFDGHCALTAYIDTFFKTHKESMLYAGMESTGGFEDNWYGLMVRLKEHYPHLKVTRINPVGIKNHHKASMQRNVTDQIAAVNIASYMISYPEKLIFGEDTAFNRMTKQWNVTQMMIKHYSQLQNQLWSRYEKMDTS